MPDTYSIPAEPDATRVRATDDSGMSFAKVLDGIYVGLWRGSDGGTYEWWDLLARFGEVEVIPLTVIEEAVAYFRRYGIPDDTHLPTQVGWKHARALIGKVVDES